MKTAVTQPGMRLAMSLALTGALAACGGGGGGTAGTPIVGPGAPAPGASSPTVTDTATVSLKLSSTTVTAGAPATATVTVVNKTGTPIPGLVVKFTTDAGLGAFSASSALTDANGSATVVLSPAAATTAGADTLRATVNYSGADYSASTGFQLTATNVTISSFTSDVPAGGSLSAYGQANLTVTLAGTSATTPVNVVLTSSCVSAGKGTLTPASVTTSTGRATFTFRDQACGTVASSENLQVSVTGTSLTQSLSIPVSSPLASSIGFVSASPTSIYLRGSGYVESSDVTFQVKDAANNGLPGQTVVLTPSVLVGGLTLDDQTGSVTKATDSNGNVIVRVNSGTVPTPVRIRATLQGSNISTVSSSLAIAVGLPSQLNFSVAQGTQNIEGYDIQGTANTYTVVASDRLGNPVPDGTSVNFIAEGGQIQAIRQTALSANGIATATANFVSAAPVPQDGRVTVLAYALGEESFLDTNGDNVYTAGEAFQNLGDLYLDRKYDNFFNAAEDQFVSLGKGDTASCALPAGTPASTAALLATDVSIPNRDNTCSTGWGQAYVRRALQTVLSTSAARPLWGTARPAVVGAASGVCAAPLALIDRYVSDQPARYAVDASGNPIPGKTTYYPLVGSNGVGTSLYGLGGSGAFSFLVADANPIAFNPMAAGTTVSVSATDGLTATVLGGSPVPSSTVPTAVSISYKFDTASSGTISVNLRSPSGVTTTIPVFVTTLASPGACTN